MEQGTKQALGWSHIVLGILIGLTVLLNWSSWLLYLWGILVLLLGVWELTT